MLLKCSYLQNTEIINIPMDVYKVHCVQLYIYYIHIMSGFNVCDVCLLKCK